MTSRNEPIESFDFHDSPLEGANLIEASAGSGKTYTISCLFLRLVLEKRLPVNEILVVTYTVAATEELRDRIRRKIRQAIEAFSTGDSQDLFLRGLIQKVRDAEDSIRLLRSALRDFDEAAVFTIHGFCQRTLHESAFESGSLFDTELKPEQESGLMLEITQDFWRQRFYHAPFEFVSYALSQKYGPNPYLALLRQGISHPDAKIVPDVSPSERINVEPFRQTCKKLRQDWPTVRSDVERKLNDPALYADYSKKLGQYMGTMDDYMAENMPIFPLPEEFEKFTTAGLIKKTKKNQPAPRHPFFILCDELKEEEMALQREMDRQLLSFKREIFRYLDLELPARKQRRNIQSFDDLLLRLRYSLEKAGGDELSQTIRNRYRAALIDEFQDTDPVQYTIFRNVFSKGGAILYLIGDPKQAIYSFRGADLFAYIKASDQVDCRYTLTGNWRSEPGLIKAVNAIFSNAGNPFLYQEIPFKEASSGEGKDHEYLRINGQTEPPFHLWFVDSNKVADGKVINKGVAYDLIPDAIAGEISRLIVLGTAGKALIGDRPLREADIAVLTRTNREARFIQEALSELKISSVLFSTGNLFDTYEAMEINRVLEGIADPQQEGLIRAALATDMIGVRGETLEDLRSDEAGWEEWLSRFRDYYDMWRNHGFIHMFRYFLLKEKVRSRLLSLPNGERRLTNVLHLSEVLHQAALEEKLGMRGLLKWLAGRRDTDSQRLEEHQLRLESDANAVKIVTIHKSKGLEYPIVFCPFNWDKSEINPKEAFAFHNERDNWRLNLVLNPNDRANLALAEREELAENIRLLYVSLTRARNRCYLVWGRLKDAETSSLSYILHPPGTEATNVVEATGKHFREMTDETIRKDLESLAQRSLGNILLYDIPISLEKRPIATEKATGQLTGKEFSVSVARDWQTASFSSLTSGHRANTELPGYVLTGEADHDQMVPQEEPLLEEEAYSIFAFPRGAKAGSLLHDILENLDFTEKDQNVITKLVNGKLREYGFDQEWQGTISEMIAKVIEAPLQPPTDGFTLSRIAQKDRLSELEFCFPLQRITPESLRKTFVDSGGPEISGDFSGWIQELDFHPVKGFMKGFIDLVFQYRERFYIVDWKSNFLGNRIEDYNSKRIAREMEENFYYLQSNLYVLALHQYLKKRIWNYHYKEHFGGVFYIFLRGVDPPAGAQFGISRDLPGEELVEALSRNLIAS